MKPTLVEPQSPSGYGKVPFATSGPPYFTNTGDIHKNNYKNIVLQICINKFTKQHRHLAHSLCKPLAVSCYRTTTREQRAASLFKRLRERDVLQLLHAMTLHEQVITAVKSLWLT